RGPGRDRTHCHPPDGQRPGFAPATRGLAGWSAQRAHSPHTWVLKGRNHRPPLEPLEGTTMLQYADHDTNTAEQTSTGWVPDMPEGIRAVAQWLDDLQNLSPAFGF